MARPRSRVAAPEPVPATPQGDLERDGPYLRLPRGGDFPDRCVACNAPAEGRLRRASVVKTRLGGITSSSVISLVVGAALLEALLPFLSLAAAIGVATRERVTLALPVCGRHRYSSIVPTVLVWIYAAVLVFLIGGAAVAAWYDVARWLVTGAQWTALGALPWAALCFGLRAWLGVKPLTVEAADANYLWLSGADKAFVKSIYRVNSPRRQQLNAAGTRRPAHVDITA